MFFHPRGDDVGQCRKIDDFLHFEGNVTIAGIDAVYAQFVAALPAGGAVVIDISSITDADLSFVQLIEAARVYAAAEDRSLALASPAGSPVLEILQRGGFLDDPSSDRTAFWLGGATAP